MKASMILLATLIVFAQVAAAGDVTLLWDPSTEPELAGYQVCYGTSSRQYTTVVNVGNVTTYTVSGLAVGTYYFSARTYDSAGLQSDYSNEVTTVVSGSSDTTPPVISAIASSSITSSAATIAWTTNEAADSQVKYGSSIGYGLTTPLNSTPATAHSVALTGLAAATTYHYQVLSRDAAGNLAASGDFTFTTPAVADITPPVISAVSSSSITSSAATIAWTTNETADSRVEYGPTTSYGSSTALNTAMVKAHSQTLTSLSPDTTYYYRVKSKDAAGNEAVSGSYSFSTTQPIDITTGLVAAYGFDEGIGSTSADLSGSGNAAYIYSSSWTTGKYGKALYFNGTKSYVSAGTLGLPGLNQPKTVSSWVYLNSRATSTQSMIVLANTVLQAALDHGLKGTKMGVLDFADTWLVIANLPSLKRWHHMAYVFDGAQNRLYIDGILTGTSTIIPSAAPVTNFQIGRWISGSEYFKGNIDEVRIYSRALNLEELNAVMTVPVSAGAAAGQALPSSGEPVALSAREETVVSEDAAVRIVTNPVVDIHLERQSYRQGETVVADGYWISNPSLESRKVELKTWLALPGMLPIAYGNPSADGFLTLAPGFNLDYGPMEFFQVSKDAPEGTCEFNARLIDPVTGNILSEDMNTFSILGHNRTNARRVVQSSDVVLESRLADSGYQYVISNNGTIPAAVELKMWLEAAGSNPVPVYSLGADGSLVLPPGASLSVDPLPLASFPATAGVYALRARILDQVTGEILFESESDLAFR
jgi:hypothetical protein